jgi:K+-transporting ATPase ATPase A chain
MDIMAGGQAAIFLAILLLCVKPVGTFMAAVYQGERTILSPALAPVERLLYRLCGIDPAHEMDWKRYAAAMLLFNAVCFASLFALLLGQQLLPLNPQRLAGFAWPLALNTAVSFTTNTNWQNYGGEQTASYFTQMVGFTVHNFVSAATGMATAIALVRGFVRRKTAGLGNFWVDLTRGTLYILLPLSLVASLLLVSQGVIQNVKTYENTTPMESVPGREVLIPMGPVASQEAIKELGTNGGGFFNANSAHPFENPTPLANFLEMLLILLIPTGLTYTYGRMAGNTRQGWALLAAMFALFVLALGTLYAAESRGNPLVAKLGVQGAYLEGKETRFGVVNSVLFATATTATSCGAVNAMHDSLTPLGGLVPLGLILLGEVVFGGVGTGLYTMFAFVVVAVFIAGLMIGRTPEYLGKKIEVREMWLSIVTVLIAGVLVLIFSGVAMVLPAGVAAMANPGAHGLSEVLYGFASMANNNGSAFGGLNGNTLFYNLIGALAMLIGRYVPAVAMLALAGSLAEKKFVPPSLGTLPTDQAPFVLWLILVIVIVGALTFFPALAMGPLVEHLALTGGA